MKFTQDAREKEKRALCSLHILGDSQDIFSFNYLGANYRKLHTRWRAPGPANAIIITPTAIILFRTDSSLIAIFLPFFFSPLSLSLSLLSVNLSGKGLFLILNESPLSARETSVTERIFSPPILLYPL